MAEIKKYLDTVALGTLVDQIKSADAKTLESAKGYADGLATNYDAAGAAATALSDAKAYTDGLANGQVKTNKEDIAKLKGDATTEGSVAKAIADAKALIDADVDAVETTANKNKEDIAAINHAETGILAQAKKYTDDEVAEVQGAVDELAEFVGELPEGATATTIVAYVQEKTAGIATEGALSELQATVTQLGKDIDAVEADYLKAADKTELEDKITAAEGLVATEQSRAEGKEAELAAAIKGVTDDYLKAADKTELEGKITAEAETARAAEEANAAAIKAIADDYLKAADKDALQTQINTIMNNPDAEGAINSINEFTQYVKDHGTIAEGFRTDIDKNKEDIAVNAKAIADQATSDAATYATKTELADEKKALQDEIDADVKVVADDLAELAETVEGLADTKADKTALETAVQTLEGVDAGFETRIAAVEGKLGTGEGSVATLIATAKEEAIAAAATDAANKDAVVLSEAQGYTDAEIEKVEGSIATLTETVGTKAAQSDLTALTGRVTTAEGEIDTLQTEMDAVEALAAANKAAHEANAAAIALKASQADLEAAVARIAKNETDIGTLNTAVAGKAETSALEAAVARIAKNETDIAANASAIGSFTAITSDEVNALFA